MKIIDFSEKESRKAARKLFPNSSHGRSLCGMAADYFGTDVETIHRVGGLVIVLVVYLKIRK